MSCCWDIRCVDCGENHGFHDLNHEERLMAALIRHRHAIAGLVALVRDPDARVELVVEYREIRIDPSFFEKHKWHHLRPVNEYGQLLGDCDEWVSCPQCGGAHPCRLPEDHEGTHQQGEPHP
jgi:hypothetical protein